MRADEIEDRRAGAGTPANGAQADRVVRQAAESAHRAAGSLAAAPAGALDEALRAMARLLLENAASVRAANEHDVGAARTAGMSGALLDRLRLSDEHRRPVGVIGANFEARPNVVVDIASQFIKSRNAGVLVVRPAP